FLNDKFPTTFKLQQFFYISPLTSVDIGKPIALIYVNDMGLTGFNGKTQSGKINDILIRRPDDKVQMPGFGKRLYKGFYNFGFFQNIFLIDHRPEIRCVGWNVITFNSKLFCLNKRQISLYL